MFWSGNYIAVRELNSLLKEENVTLSQVLEADDILQECKADNKALIQFLTKPEILADLITLITEEPPKNVELATQYRYANIACEVLTSHLSMLSDRLSLDAAQMNRLCDFLNQDPPLNPLLASYFSKTVEMLLEKSPKQDWCLHHIVCLRVLDFFKSRRDFLPNLLRHMSTSAVADVFKYLMRIDDLIKTVMEWLEEHQFLECLIQIICGTYVPESLPAAPEPERAQAEGSEAPADRAAELDGAAVNADGDKELANVEGDDKSGGEATHTEAPAPPATVSDSSKEAPVAEGAGRARTEADERAAAESAAAAALAAERTSAAASANAAALLCDLIINGCRPRTGWVIVSRLQSVRSVVAALSAERGVRTLLQAMFTSPPRARRHALVHGTQVLLALLHHDPPQLEKGTIEEEAARTYAVGTGAERSGVELGVAPHLPLLHQALLHAPAPGAVGLARVQVAALLAHLALSEVEEVAATMLTLGTPGVLVDMFFEYPNNNFLHAQVYTLLKHALTNRVYRTQYARHLLVECDLLSRLMDVFEENKSNKEAALAGGAACGGKARAAYMGHAVLALALCARALDGDAALAHALSLPPAAAARWPAFREQALRPLLQHHDMPLGGYYPSENFYEVEIMPDPMATNYDYNDIGASGAIDELPDDLGADDPPEMCGAGGSVGESPDFIADGLGIDDSDKMEQAKNNFLELASQRFGADMWDESGDADENDLDAAPDAARDVLDQHSPWESSDSGACGGEGWAHFGSAPPLLPHDPFAPAPPASPPRSPPSPRSPHSPHSPRRSPRSPRSPATPPADEHFAEFSPYWPYDAQPIDSNSTTKLESSLASMRLDGELSDERMDSASSASLANNLLTAMSAMSPDAIANIVNANLPSPPSPAAPPAPPAPPAPQGGQAGQEHR